MVSRDGNTSTRKKSPKTSVKAVGATMVKRRSHLLRRGRAHVGAAAARAIAPPLQFLRPHLTAGRRRPSSTALVELQREGGHADPGARHADRHGAVEPGARKQEGRHW